MTDRVRKISTSPWRTFFAAGKQRSGKTFQARSIVEAVGVDQVIFLDCESGLTTLSDLDIEMFVLLDAEDYQKLDNSALLELYMKRLKEGLDYIRKHVDRYAWYVSDGGTFATDMIEQYHRDLMDTGRDHVGSGGKKDTFGMWGGIAQQQMTSFQRLVGLPICGYFTMLSEIELERNKEGKPTGKKWTEPAVSGRKFVTRLPSWWDMVMHFTAEDLNGEKHFYADTQGNEEITAGSRIPPTIHIPKKCHLGMMDVEGHTVVTKDDWSIYKMYERLVGKEVGNE